MRDYRPARGGLASANEKRFLLETKGGTGQGVRQTRYMKTGHSRMGCDLLFCVVRPEGVEPSTSALPTELRARDVGKATVAAQFYHVPDTGLIPTPMATGR